MGGIGALIVGVGLPTALTHADSSPVLATEVPSTLPAAGVDINHQVTLIPPTVAAPPISASKALAIARTYANAQPFPARVLAANVTVPETVASAATATAPPGSRQSIHSRSIDNVPSWVIAFTSSKPTTVAQGGYFPNAKVPARIQTASHFSVVINANTGQFVVGFFTH